MFEFDEKFDEDDDSPRAYLKVYKVVVYGCDEDFI